MNPRDTPKEEAFRRQARLWLEENAIHRTKPPISPSAIVAEWKPDEEQRRLEEARRWQARKFDAGWAGISWPAELGGRGETPVHALIFDEEELEFDVPRDALAVGIGWCGPAILELGTDSQRERYLPRLLRGDEVWCQLFSEPEAGSDLAGLQTRALRHGDSWILSGQKTWTTFAHRADWGLCIARHDPAAPKHRGLTAFIVDMSAEGVEVRPIRQMTGSAIFNEVFLDDVVVEDSQRVGDPGDGWRVVITTFMFERTAAVFRVAPIVAALRSLIEHKRDDLVDRFVSIYIRERVMAYTNMRLRTSISQGGMPGPEGSLGKLFGTDLLTDLYALGIDSEGARGMLVGGDALFGGEWQDAFLGTPGLRVGGGTDQIQRNIIAERILGLPGEPKLRVGG